MLILGFESSCDETAASVVEEKDGVLSVRSNIVASQVDVHRLYGGVVPEIASRAHTEALSRITYEALGHAGVSLSQIDVIAVTSHPGLIGALLCAVNFAKALAAANKIPLVSVDHIRGHIAAAYLMENAPKPPFFASVTSGGHTAIYRVDDYTNVRCVGSTRDDAIGESFDKIGRMIGIPYPAGAGFDRLAAEGYRNAVGEREDYLAAYAKTEEFKKYPLPSPALSGDDVAFSFSGLKTAAMNLLHHYEQTGEELESAAFAARYTYAAVTAVAEKLSLLLRKNPGMPVVLAGGVAANSHLRHAVAAVCKKQRSELFLPPLSLCGDNGAMIAAQGYYEAKAGNFADSALNASASDDGL